MKAFVLVAMKEGSERELVDYIRTLPQVKSAYILFGEWDVIAEVELPSPEALGTFVMDKVRSRDDVRLTSSLIVASK